MLTYGFYNSKDHDRRYDAIQFGSIFDGIIRDGIFMSIGNCLRVTADSGMTVLVGTGRAWFDHTWTLNDALLPLTVPQSELLMNRIDAVVLEVNASVAVRVNSIKVVKGTPSANPSPPAMVKTGTVHQYPLAYITVGQRVTEIRQANIQNMVGTSAAPFVTGILDTVNIDMLVAQWGDQWQAFFEKETADMTSTNAFWKSQWQTWYAAQTKEMQDTYKAWVAEWTTFKDTYRNEMESTGRYWRNRWEDWFYRYVNSNSNDIYSWKKENQDAFTAWWENLKQMLQVDDNILAEMAATVLELQKEVEEFRKFKESIQESGAVYVYLEGDGPVFEPITDENGGTVIDDELNPIVGKRWTTEFITTSDFKPIEICRKINFSCKCGTEVE